MRDGASQARIAGAEINRRVGKAAGRERVRQACPPFHPANSKEDGGHGASRLCPPYEGYAVTASMSSTSSSSGAKVESGLVESVIGLRLP